jgi:hypothetical protein
MLIRFLKWLLSLLQPVPTLEEEVSYNHEDFRRDYTGVAVDFDNQFGAQCVDLARLYWQKVCGLNRPQQPNTTPSGGARDLINNVTGVVAQRLRIRDLAREKPKPGDVVVWGPSPTNQWGHVAILMKIGDGHIEVFEQDGLNQGRGAQMKVWAINDRISGYITTV